MKNNKAVRLISAILAAAMLCVCFAGCSKKDDGKDDNPDITQEAMVTASPDGAVTASPTQAAGTEGAEPADNTASADPSATAGAIGTDEPAETGAAPTQGPDATQGEPITTFIPVFTAQPGNSASPRPTSQGVPGMTTPTPRPAATPGPTSQTTPRPTATPGYTGDPLTSPTVPPINSYEAHYAGSVEDAASLSVGGTFYWTLDLVNEHSRLWSGQWLVDYPEQFLKAENYSASWNGGIVYQINQTWDNDSAWSDKPEIVCNPEYNGNSGGHPVGQAGNLYANVGMYLTSFSYYGVQMSGSLIRFKFKIKALPTDSQLKHDESGYYLEIPILVYESTAMIDAPAGSPVQPFTYVPHGIVVSEPGRVYFRH